MRGTLRGTMGVLAVLLVGAAGRLNPHDVADLDESACRTCHLPDPGLRRAPAWGPVAGSAGRDGSASHLPRVAGGGSLLCLGCHDDVIAPSQRLHAASVWDETAWMDLGQRPGFGMDAHSSLPYPMEDPGFAAAVSVEAAGLPLYDGRVECATCHQPHGAEGEVPLRIPNDGSALCLTCHLK